MSGRLEVGDLVKVKFISSNRNLPEEKRFEYYNKFGVIEQMDDAVYVNIIVRLFSTGDHHYFRKNYLEKV